MNTFYQLVFLFCAPSRLADREATFGICADSKQGPTRNRLIRIRIGPISFDSKINVRILEDVEKILYKIISIFFARFPIGDIVKPIQTILLAIPNNKCNVLIILTPEHCLKRGIGVWNDHCDLWMRQLRIDSNCRQQLRHAIMASVSRHCPTNPSTPEHRL